MPYDEDPIAGFPDALQEDLIGDIGRTVTSVGRTAADIITFPFRRGGTPAPPAPQLPKPGVGGVTVNTPGGAAKVSFERPVATKESVDALEQLVNQNTRMIARLGQEIEKNTAILDKKVTTLAAAANAAAQQNQMSMMLPMLIGQPKLKSLEFAAVPAANAAVNVKNAEYEEDNNLFLLMALSGGGGLFGGSGNGSNSMLMALALSGALGKGK